MTSESHESKSGLTPDVVIIGGGVAGGALAVALARHSIRALVLEKSLEHQDRVRGEFMPPWGVEEAKQLGLLDVLLSAGGHFTKRYIAYGEDMSAHEAEACAIPLGKILPDIEGAMTCGHPQICRALNEAAIAAGATMLRGVGDLLVSPGRAPKVAFTHEGHRHDVRPRLVVGADGRGSWTARQIGADVKFDASHHLLSGLLIDGVREWPEEDQSIGVEGDITFYVFPQGGGRIRLYACYGLDQRGRFSGSDNARRFLDAFRLKSLPHANALSAGRPIGPCHGYPSGDTWIDTPVAPGVVLIGDAAGHNDPTIGQGLSVSLRDTRHVVEALTSNADWTEDIFTPYIEERRERMRRLRFVAQLFSTLRVEFTDDARMRRRRALKRMGAEPHLALPFVATQKGPFSVPPETFEPKARDQLLN